MGLFVAGVEVMMTGVTYIEVAQKAEVEQENNKKMTENKH